MTKIGIIGGGQLGRMLGIAGLNLGYEFRFFDTTKDAPARHVGELRVGAFDDLVAIRNFAEGLDVISYEFENIPAKSVEVCANRAPVYPPYSALEVSQDRIKEKSYFQKLNIPTPKFRAVSSQEDLEEAIKEIGLPSVLKTTTLGYDGKGQKVLRKPADIEGAWELLGKRALVLEQFIPFTRELSIIGARSTTGEIVFYPLAENEHKEGILRVSTVPAPNLSEGVIKKAEEYLKNLLTSMEYVGVLALELFEYQGELLANEMAPRVHNTGHWSIDGAVTSQFENHLRAILGLPLGSTAAQLSTVMINLIGAAPAVEKMAAIDGAHIHLYGKAPRPGRKIGHINITDNNPTRLTQSVQKMRALL